MPAIAIQSKNINGWLIAGIIAGVLAIIGGIAYLIYKLYHLQETLDEITKKLNSNSNQKPEKPVIDVTPEPPVSKESALSPVFFQSEDFRTVKTKNTEYLCTFTQGRVINRLWENLKKGITKLHQDILLEDLGICSKKLKDVFKKSPAWKKLVVPIGKGYYSLNLS